MKFYIFIYFLKTLNETIEEPQKGSTNIESSVICGSIIGINNFNSFRLFPKQPRGMVSILLMI